MGVDPIVIFYFLIVIGYLFCLFRRNIYRVTICLMFFIPCSLFDIGLGPQGLLRKRTPIQLETLMPEWLKRLKELKGFVTEEYLQGWDQFNVLYSLFFIRYWIGLARFITEGSSDST